MELFIVLAIIGTILFFSIRSNKKIVESWKMAAHNLHLTYSDDGVFNAGTITGRRSGHRISVSSYRQEQGKSSKEFTKYRVTYRTQIPVDFKITRQGAFHGIANFIGFQDIEVGNPSFDNRVVLRGKNAARIIEYLTPERQKKIEKMVAESSHILITNKYVEINQVGKTSSVASICHFVKKLEFFANELTESSKRSHSNKSRSHSKPIVPPLPVTQTAPPPLSKKEKQEPQTVEPKRSEPPKVPELPKIPELPPLNEPNLDVEKAQPQSEIPPQEGNPPVEEKEPLTQEIPPLEILPLASELFGKDSSNSLLNDNVFDEKYKGKKVKGTGTLKRVDRFNYDPVFTNTSGVKALIHLCELEGTYSKTVVLAEIKFPLEKLDELSGEIDQEIAFEGTLFAQNTLLHKLFVEGSDS